MYNKKAINFYYKNLRPKINNEIQAKEVRVIDAQGKNLGVMNIEDALKLIDAEKGLDLIEIAPQANPPVVRLMNYDKWRYEQEKKQKREAFLKKSKSTSIKYIQITPRASQHDLEIKAKQLENFLNKGYIIEIQMQLRGREKLNKEWAMQKLNDFLNLINLKYKILSSPKEGGRGIIVQLEKLK
jgi:translation initiation factor IF-3